MGFIMNESLLVKKKKIKKLKKKCNPNSKHHLKAMNLCVGDWGYIQNLIKTGMEENQTVRTMTGESSIFTPSPLQMLMPARESEEPNRNAGRELQIASTSAPFRLPDDWFVELKPRGSTTSSTGRVDKYYYEPRTGQQFRSLVAVERYLRDKKQDTPTPDTVKARNENTHQVSRNSVPTNPRGSQAFDKEFPASSFQLQIRDCTIRSTSPFKLPDDWVIEEKPRSNINYAGVIDKLYIEPETGQRFRSLKAVERYLTEAKENTATPKASQNSGSWKKNISSIIRSPRVVSKHRLEAEEDNITLKALKLCRSKASPNSGSGKKNIPGIIRTPGVVSKCWLEAEEDNITLKALKFCNSSKPSRKSGSRKKFVSNKGVNASMLDCASPPAKINWVLSGPGGGNVWSAFINESIVPDSVKQKWSEKFITTIHAQI
ncbi:methyl-CpG-binding domain-containing protein 7 isoform X1 [Carya illinoinensis]|uniref:methyl-CpG-binding domain-containing protein 7 isoform X1 n=1 Tax=Carya illinoinensis TaxID=32201 RepID=UPI001C72939E|nr:methyl-CpG-binding domain-containing protein 7 isoform X1 [Carya illinoinensis]XP_042954487.1 methyl-CpG-binding domain-containing protein 7 isoform X1 [Carya illinoinensis]XP_042954488.1 methyl-CpG-binding domain-containing protein 7 isoform X1 [Carya illinoinensis]